MMELVHDPVVFQTRVVAVETAVAEGALPHQPGLGWAAKLISTAEGTTGLVAEVPRLASSAEGEALAGEAMEAARAWVDEPAVETSAPPAAADDLEALLEEAGRPWRALDDGRFRLDVAHAGAVGRIELCATRAGGLQLAARGAVGLGDGSSFPALVAYALEANRRLRLARVSVGAGGGAAAWLAWDAVLPAGLPRGPALEEGVRAVAIARSVTEGALRALAEPAIAEAFLALRAVSRPSRRRRKR